MKKLLYFIPLMLLLLFCTIYYLIIHERSEVPEITLLKSFQNCGVKVVTSEMYFSGRLNKKYDNIGDIKLLADKISSDLGVVNNSIFSRNVMENDNLQKIEITGNDKENSHVSIRAQLTRDSKKEYESYISIAVTEDVPRITMQDKRLKVLEVLKKSGITPKVNTCITGNLNGKLNNEQVNDVCKSIFSTAEAEKVEGIKNGGLISVSAYSPLMEDSIRVNERRVNLNLAIRYNSYENKTYIWLATPVITTEY